MSDSAETVGSVLDLLMQIWLWLPVKSLMRFKSVSKNWKCLITSPQFALLRNPNPNPNPAVGLFCPSRKRRHELEYISLDGKIPVDPPSTMLHFPDVPFTFWIQQSCNGLLLCCSSENRPEPVNAWYGWLRMDSWSPTCRFACYIYNPTTKCVTKLPRPGVHGILRIVHGVNFAFDQTKSTRYKVVCVRQSEFARELFQIEIYSPESGAWRVSGEPFRATASFDYGVYWNNSIHWISYRPRELLYFNVEEEKFGKVDVPDVDAAAGLAQGVKKIVLEESCDHLHMIQRYDIEATFNVYEMKRDYSEWFVKYRVDLTTVASAFRAVSYRTAVMRKICILSLVRGKEGAYLVLHLSHKVVKFNLESNNFEEICDLEDPAVGSRSACAQYIESLACV